MIAVGHRGSSSDAPENTLAAIRSAIAAGAGGIEIDIQLTLDGVPVVIHDDALDRTTDGAGLVAAARADEIASLDAGCWFGPQFAGERVPLLTDVLDLLVDAQGVDLLLEVKGAWDAQDIRGVTDAIAERELTDRVVPQSFSVATVAALAAAAPRQSRGLIVDQADDRLLDLCRELGVVACNPRGGILREQPGLVDRLHANGMTVTPWTLNTPEHWAAARDLGVDGATTDRPAELVAWLAGA